MFALANPPQPPFCKGGRGRVPGDVGFPSFRKGGTGCVPGDPAFPSFCKGGSACVPRDPALPPFSKGGQGGFALARLHRRAQEQT